MDIKNLKTFINVAKLGSFTKAANEMNYVQSTVTTQIQQLEKELGYPVFDRIGKKVSLTTLGAEFLKSAYSILNILEKAETKGKDTYKRRLNPQTATYSAVSFSFAVISLWEIQEFFSDYFIGSQNQGYYYAPPEDDIFFRIFGDGAAKGAGQYPLWDTMMDMTDAAVTTVISGIILLTVLIKIKKKYEN